MRASKLCRIHFLRSAVQKLLPRSPSNSKLSRVNSCCKLYQRFSFSAPVAQLDRASAYEAEGREFEPLRARHYFP